MNGQYSVKKTMSFKTPMLRSDMCDYRDAYLGVKRRITVEGTNVKGWTDEVLTFKNKGPFR